MTEPGGSETTGTQGLPADAVLSGDLPTAVLAEARRELPGDVTAYHDALMAAADAHDPIRMDHLVHGWSVARDVLDADTDEEHRAWAVLDRRLGQVLFGEGLPAAADVLVAAIAHASASGDTVEELRCRLAFVPVEVAVGDATALDSGAGYVEQLLALEEYSHAAGGLMGLAHVVPDDDAASMLLRASHLYERAGDGGWAAEAAVIAARAMTTTGDARLADTLQRAHQLVEAHPTVELRISLAEIQALLAWQGGDPASAAAVLRAAIEAAARTGRPVPPGLQVMLCDLLVETGELDQLREPASALVEVGQLLGDDELTSMGERYLALVP